MDKVKPDSDGLVKIELGCGKTKQPGYIGIDRFPLPNVDIVADLNKEIPLDDNTVDIIWASHSLEHLNDIEHVMMEIYRICKDKAIVFVLAPYYHAGLNQANHYHKVVFNEETFRFFSVKEANPWLAGEDWYYPLHSAKWGLSESDNSNKTTEFCQIHTEYFYFKAYRGLDESQKRHARKAFQNVCDQIFYILLVDKNGLLMDEAQERREFALRHVPGVIQALRIRDMQPPTGTSILNDIDDNIRTQLALQMKQCTEMVAALESGMTAFKRESQATDEFTAELLRSLEQNSRLYSKQRKRDIAQAIKQDYPAYYEGLRHKGFGGKETELLLPSCLLGYKSYTEYAINADGNILHLVFFGKYGSEVLVELVYQNTIIDQKKHLLLDEGVYTMTIPKVQGSIEIRLQTARASDFVRVLEMVTRRKVFLCKRTLAAYVD